MDVTYPPKEMDRVAKARDNYSGRLLSDPHFDEAMMITKIIEDEIQSSGRFAEKLNDYSAAYARTKKNLSIVQAETIIRDLYKERTGQSMKQTLDGYQQREENLTAEQRRGAYSYAEDVGSMIEHGNKLSFHRAYSNQAKSYALDLNITDLGAKRIMSEQFEAVRGEKLYDWGKSKETTYYRPQIEAERQERRAQRLQNQTQKRSPQHSMS